MVSQLDLHRALHETLRQPREQTAGANDLLFGLSAGEQLVDQLVRQALAQPRRQTLADTPRGRRRLALQRAAGATQDQGSILTRELVLLVGVIVGIKLLSRVHGRASLRRGRVDGRALRPTTTENLVQFLLAVAVG
jgi:hypothetical protein